MVNLVLKFVSCARAAGLRVSSSEVLDCLNQLELVDILEETQFASVLRANFAKSRREQHHFDRLYHLFFHEMRQDSSIAHSEALAEEIQQSLENLPFEPNGDPSYQAVMDFLQGDPLRFLEQMRQVLAGGNGEGSGMGANLGAVVGRLELMLQINAFENALLEFFNDQRGRMNLVTPERRLRAAQAVEEGFCFCLSMPLDLPGGNAVNPKRVLSCMSWTDSPMNFDSGGMRTSAAPKLSRARLLTEPTRGTSLSPDPPSGAGGMSKTRSKQSNSSVIARTGVAST